MNAKERMLAQLRALCAEPGPEDGLPLPRRRQEKRRDMKKNDRRLAGQVARSVSLTLGSSEDALLQSLLVEEALPDPDARRIRLRLLLPGVTDLAMLDAAHARLAAAAGLLREAVAADLQRKRTPLLVFEIRPAGDARPEVER